MIHLTRGDLLTADVEALVNAVNTVGAMGKGIALQFKQTFPENFKAYESACRSGEFRVGQVLTVPLDRPGHPRYIINFPTKSHWRDKSKLEYIDSGLEALIAEIERLGIRSIALPPLGCGLGGLSWPDVQSRIDRAVSQLESVDVFLYEPAGPAA